MKVIYKVESDQGRFYIDDFDDVAKALNCLGERRKDPLQGENWRIKAINLNERCERVSCEFLADDYEKGASSAIRVRRSAFEKNLTRDDFIGFLGSYLEKPDFDTPAMFERGFRETLRAIIESEQGGGRGW